MSIIHPKVISRMCFVILMIFQRKCMRKNKPLSKRIERVQTDFDNLFLSFYLVFVSGLKIWKLIFLMSIPKIVQFLRADCGRNKMCLWNPSFVWLKDLSKMKNSSWTIGNAFLHRTWFSQPFNKLKNSLSLKTIRYNPSGSTYHPDWYEQPDIEEAKRRWGPQRIWYYFIKK